MKNSLFVYFFICVGSFAFSMAKDNHYYAEKDDQIEQHDGKNWTKKGSPESSSFGQKATALEEKRYPNECD